jgi:hypothetical protein
MAIVRTRFPTPGAIVFCSALLLGSGAADAASTKVLLAVGATGADPDARGKIVLSVRSNRKGLSAKLTVKANRLSPSSVYDVTVDGVRIGGFTSTKGGSGRARFSTAPTGKDQLLGVDPRGRAVAVIDGAGATLLLAGVPAGGVGTTNGNDIRCCLPDDSGPECEDRTAEECVAQGGTDLGPGSCLPNPCASGPPAPGSDIVCCLPDDSGPECEDRTEAECSAQGGVNLGTGSCSPNPCPPAEPGPDDDVRCCLPDDSGPECEDRTAAECAAQGGVNIGAGACVANPCLGGATTTTTTSIGGTSTTSTTLPGGGAVVQVTCERRSDRSRISVNGNNLASGTYRARVMSGANTATAGQMATIGDEVEFDFDSNPDDIAAGATAIAVGFIQGAPPQVTGQLLDAAGTTMVVEATVTCEEN